MKFRNLRPLDDDLRNYIFELEMIDAGLKGYNFFTKRFPVVSLVINNYAIKFERKVDYYDINSQIPLEVFEKIYSDEWKEEIIPGGKRGPKGLLQNTVYFDSNGARIVSQADYDKIVKIIGPHTSPIELIRSAPPSGDFSEIGVGYIKDCEIYTVEALHNFVSILKENH